VSVVRGQLDVSATGRTLFRRSSIECGVSKCDLETECGVSECDLETVWSVSDCDLETQCGVSDCDLEEFRVSKCVLERLWRV
jgi:hypothetical protein